ncbi:hypothetical protein AVEN_235336-1 [Araneus ventricosus]|uniref:THAP-type domain-containing protein n=1 Tax=Araneus ventricosus TaxID=182803 RepID=A0A4Y2A3J3_ARAVE|nr:hypothetical protein AVEN_235336-1 [Araneus ventricosus]
MSTCVVATCSTYHRKRKDKGVIYHVFPVCPNLNKIWISKCKRQDHRNVKCAKICSDHSRRSDYMDDMKNRLLGLNQKKILKSDAAPSVNLPLQDNGEGYHYLKGNRINSYNFVMIICNPSSSVTISGSPKEQLSPNRFPFILHRDRTSVPPNAQQVVSHVRYKGAPLEECSSVAYLVL